MKLLPPDKIKYFPIRIKDKRLWYFDGEKIVKEHINEAYKDIPYIRITTYTEHMQFMSEEFDSITYTIHGLERRYPTINGTYSFNEWHMGLQFDFEYIIDGEGGRVNATIGKSFGASLEVGDDYSTLLRKFEEAEVNYQKMRENIKNGVKKYDKDSIERFVTRIDRPNIIRLPENPNKNTFDIIKIEVNICSNWENKRQYIKGHIREIYQMVIDKLENSKTFTRFNVPAGCLAVTSIYETQDSSLVFTFELKKELRGMED